MSPSQTLFVCVASVLASTADDAAKSHTHTLDGSRAKRWTTRTAETRRELSSLVSKSDYDSDDNGDLGISSDEPDDNHTNNPNRSAEAGGWEQGRNRTRMPVSLLTGSNGAAPPHANASSNDSQDDDDDATNTTSSTTAPPNSSGRCDDTCEYAHDKSCDDGSDPDAERSGSAPTCELGTDCADCTAAAKHGKHHPTTAHPPTTTTTTSIFSPTAVSGSLTLRGLGPKAITSTMQDALKAIIADEAPSARAKDVVLHVIIDGGHLFRRRRRLLEGGEEVRERGGAMDAEGVSVTVDYEIKLSDKAAAATTKANIKVS